MNIKSFKSLYSLVLTIALVLFSNIAFASSFDKSEGKIKAKVDYTENPNNIDFFKSNEFEKYGEIGPHEKLDGIWSGNYSLSHK